MISIKKFAFNDFQENTFILYDETNECVFIDAGCNSTQEEDIIVSFIKKNNLTPVSILNTHGHVDHIMGNKFLKEKYNIPIIMHEKDEFLVNEAPDHAAFFGLDVDIPPLPDKYFTDNEEVKFGNSTLEVIHTPGHSPGGVCFYSEKDNFIIVGDSLFLNGIGRTDLPGGNFNTLINSIQNKLFIIPDNVKVYSGHGSETIIGYEKSNNPFLNGL